MTCKEYFEEKLPKLLEEHPEKAKSINAIYQFDISGDAGGTWTVDLTENPGVSAGASESAQCTVSASDNDFVDLLTGKLNAQMAFLQAKLKISGEIGLALKLQGILKG